MNDTDDMDNIDIDSLPVALNGPRFRERICQLLECDYGNNAVVDVFITPLQDLERTEEHWLQLVARATDYGTGESAEWATFLTRDDALAICDALEVSSRIIRRVRVTDDGLDEEPAFVTLDVVTANNFGHLPWEKWLGVEGEESNGS
jgi:hypothetical protein